MRDSGWLCLAYFGVAGSEAEDVRGPGEVAGTPLSAGGVGEGFPAAGISGGVAALEGEFAVSGPAGLVFSAPSGGNSGVSSVSFPVTTRASARNT